MPRFSLVLCTLGRTAEPDAFLRSLEAQARDGVEVIVVDQNPDGRIGSLVARHPSLDVRLVRSEPGLSRARNRGLLEVTGEIVAFPDDDCVYPPRLLDHVALVFERFPEIECLTARAVDESGADVAGRWRKESGWLTPRTVLGAHVSFTMFVRRRVIDAVGGFDERLGLGAATQWGAGEETDYLLRALELGYRGWYDAGLEVRHPAVRPPFDAPRRERARSYGRGLGHVLRQHRFPAWWGPYWCARPLASAGMELARGDVSRARYHLEGARGRLEGWFGQ